MFPFAPAAALLDDVGKFLSAELGVAVYLQKSPGPLFELGKQHGFLFP